MKLIKYQSIKETIIPIIIGTFTIVPLAWISDTSFAMPRIPFIAILLGFLITGLIIGCVHKKQTFSEIVFSSTSVAIVLYIIISSLNLVSFSGMSKNIYLTNMLIVLLNGIILSFIGTWLGQNFRGVDLPINDINNAPELKWILSGSIFGIIISLFVAIVVVSAIGVHIVSLGFVFIIGLLLNGVVVGRSSHENTTKEAGIAGFLTVVLLINILKLSFDQDTLILTSPIIIGSLFLGFVLSLIGNFIGKKLLGNSIKVKYFNPL